MVMIREAEEVDETVRLVSIFEATATTSVHQHRTAGSTTAKFGQSALFARELEIGSGFLGYRPKAAEIFGLMYISIMIGYG